MVNGKNDNKGKIGGVRSTGGSKSVERTAGISEVESVKKTDSVAGSQSVGAIGRRKHTRTMTADERDALFKMIDEEADKLLGGSGMSPQHRAVVQKAVKMAVDAATVDDSEGE